MHLTADQIIAKLSDFSLTCETQSAWHKIANARKAVYLSKTKKRVTAIHISGFTLDHPAVVAPPKKNGKVTGHIVVDHERAAEALMLALADVADGTWEGDKFVKGQVTVSEPVKPARTRKPKVDEEAVAAEKAAELEAEMAARRELIAERAEELPVAADED